MTTIPLPIAVEAKLSSIKSIIGRLLEIDPDYINDTYPFFVIFGETRGGVALIWECIPELVERQIRVSGEWTPMSLALEWEKTLARHP